MCISVFLEPWLAWKPMRSQSKSLWPLWLWYDYAVARCICCDAAKKSSSFAWLIMQPGMIVWSLHDLFQEKAKGEIVKARCAEALIGGLSRLVVGMYGMYAMCRQRFITPQDLAVQGRLRRFSDLSLLSLPVPATTGVELRSQKQSFRRKRCQGGGRWTDEQMNEAQQSLMLRTIFHPMLGLKLKVVLGLPWQSLVLLRNAKI